jgi:hypothetical protein
MALAERAGAHGVVVTGGRGADEIVSAFCYHFSIWRSYLARVPQWSLRRGAGPGFAAAVRHLQNTFAGSDRVQAVAYVSLDGQP